MKEMLQKYLASCARKAIEREKPRIIAVAGSVGKSSTKNAIGIALGAGEPGSDVRVSAKNYNNEIGLPLTIFSRSAPGRSFFSWIDLLWRATFVGLGWQKIGARTLVLEYGTDHPGDLDYLISIAPPDIGVITAIGPEHTEFFGNVENVAKEELSLIRALDKNGTAILNADNSETLAGKLITEADTITFGEDVKADVRLISTQVVLDQMDPTSSGLDIHVVTLGLAARLRLRGAFGKPQALAVTAALAVVLALDIDFHEASERLKKYRGMPGRTQLIPGIKRTILLDDTYNSSPLAALSAVRDLASFPLATEGKRIAAIGDMLELGNLSEDAHAQLGKEIAQAGIDMLVACGTLAHAVANSAKTAGMSEDRVFTFAKSPEAGLFLQGKIKPGDVILIKGSQGARMEKIVKELMADPLRAKELLVRQTEEWEA